MSEDDNRCFVSRTAPVEALCEPTFVIKVGQTFYMTLAVWACDPDAPEPRPEQADTARELAQAFDAARARGEVLESIVLRHPRPRRYMSTNPGGGHA